MKNSYKKILACMLMVGLVLTSNGLVFAEDKEVLTGSETIEYKQADYEIQGISFKAPEDWIVEEDEEGDYVLLGDITYGYLIFLGEDIPLTDSLNIKILKTGLEKEGVEVTSEPKTYYMNDKPVVIMHINVVDPEDEDNSYEGQVFFFETDKGTMSLIASSENGNTEEDMKPFVDVVDSMINK